ncbi:hypothetical protein LG634_08915 [Streptomyces bambusae]|uniref:hypothetical protein n=1 Tax=Streptomyces bambusae TaxID=1550616 RepID=UPI001CFD88EF|nr:hypothetical protein [Streptomyces bambusae]MCB5164948.1 hypothetical protein [Streptomyces bambusae]
MRISRGAVLAVAVAVSSIGLAGSAEARPVSGIATTGDCDNIGENDAVGNSGSRSASGRTITLYTAKITDSYAKAAIEGDVQRYDKVWIDRSLKLFTMGGSPGHPSDATVQANGGWKQCGPFEATWWNASWNYVQSSTVALQQSGKSYAVRACMRPHDSNVSTCTDWFIDHT